MLKLARQNGDQLPFSHSLDVECQTELPEHKGEAIDISTIPATGNSFARSPSQHASIEPSCICDEWLASQNRLATAQLLKEVTVVVVVEPCKGALDYPAPWQQHEALMLSERLIISNVYFPILASASLSLPTAWTPSAKHAVTTGNFYEHPPAPTGTIAVLNISGVDDRVDEITAGLGEVVSFAPDRMGRGRTSRFINALEA